MRFIHIREDGVKIIHITGEKGNTSFLVGSDYDLKHSAIHIAGQNRPGLRDGWAMFTRQTREELEFNRTKGSSLEVK